MKSSSKLFTLLAAMSALAAVASADTVTFGPDNGNYRKGLGGEFTILVNGSDPFHLTAGYSDKGTSVTVNGRTGLQTFCIQYNEHMNFNTEYDYSLSTAAKGPSGTDEISLGTAWLYSLFATHTLADYVYTPGPSLRADSAALLQNAFWYLEDEINLSNPLDNIFLLDASNKFGGLAAAKADANGAFGVEVLNLGVKGSGKYDAQDQLVWPEPRKVPDSTATLGLVALAFAGIVGLRRRFSK